jgi:hypothetical protein
LRLLYVSWEIAKVRQIITLRLLSPSWETVPGLHMIGAYVEAVAILDMLTYLLTPWSRVLLEKIISLQPVNKFPAFYGTRRFITTFTSACHLSLS